MQQNMMEKISNLIDVKSIITLSAIGVYLFMEARGMTVSPELNQLITIIVAFYFGTQSQKVKDRRENITIEKEPKTKN